jgi:hypothetical protein
LQRGLTLLPGQVVRRGIVELVLVGLAAGDAAIEEDVVLERREQRLGRDRDGYGRAALLVLGFAADRIEQVFVFLAWLAGEIAPEEILDRVLGRLDPSLLVRMGNERFEYLEARQEVALLGDRVDSFDGESEQPLLGRGRRVDSEGDGVRAGHGKDLQSVFFRRLEAHDALLDGPKEEATRYALTSYEAVGCRRSLAVRRREGSVSKAYASFHAASSASADQIRQDSWMG